MIYSKLKIEYINVFIVIEFRKNTKKILYYY